MMTPLPQLRKVAIKKRASHPSSIQEPDLDIRKLVDEPEQAEITMKLVETENLKLQYVNNIQTTTPRVNNIHDSDTELSEKITKVLNICEKDPKFTGKPSFKKWCNFAEDMDTALSKAEKNNSTIKINHKNIENQINHFISI